eukprot:688457_1
MADICSGNGYTIYCNYETQEFYAEGDNTYGVCAIPKRTRYKGGKHGQYLLRSINYFRIHNIKISKCCTNITSKCTFWITQNNQIYANGKNDAYQLGIASTQHQFVPCIIEDLRDVQSTVVDIKSNMIESVALCRMDIEVIVNGYCRTNHIGIAQQMMDVKQLIGRFHGVVGSVLYHTQDRTVDISNGYGMWKEITDLHGKDIVQIDCCNEFFLFLESNGIIWKYQIRVAKFQMGNHEHYLESFNFMLSNIRNGPSGRVIEIACGVNNGSETNYVLLRDEMCGVYSWSDQCCEPQRVYGLRDDILKIECGSDHAYVMNDKNQHFVWGNNYYNECMNGKNTMCKTPYCINKTVKRIGIRTGKYRIKQVSLGTNCTKLIVGYPQ